MDSQLIVSLIGVGSALLGSLVGGITSYLSTKSMRTLEWKLAQLEKDSSRKETLYSDFLGHANQFMLQSIDKKSKSASDMKSLINLESTIRLTSPPLRDLAREIVSCVLDHHQEEPQQKRSYPKLRDEFIEKCRAELDALRTTV